MHAFSHHRTLSEASAKGTKELVLAGGWRYDLHAWLVDTCLFQGQVRELRRRTVNLAHLAPGEQVLDVGCGTETLALDAQHRVGSRGRVVGIDPGNEQIAWARAKAARRHVPSMFQIGAIEQLAFPDKTFDVVLSTLMLHHVHARLRAQGLAEIARVFKPGGRVVIADFKHKQERSPAAARFHAGGSDLQELATMVAGTGFVQVDLEELQPARFSLFPGVSFVKAYKSSHACAHSDQDKQGHRKSQVGSVR